MPFLRTASQAMLAGALETALQAASEACHRAPLLPAAHYLYGQVWLALGRNREAERAFAQALQLDPAWADAWINYGVARYREGHIEDAEEMS
jgi:tetratricopeptide (TPR) repeat protein